MVTVMVCLGFCKGLSKVQSRMLGYDRVHALWGQFADWQAANSRRNDKPERAHIKRLQITFRNVKKRDLCGKPGPFN